MKIPCFLLLGPRRPNGEETRHLSLVIQVILNPKESQTWSPTTNLVHLRLHKTALNANPMGKWGGIIWELGKKHTCLWTSEGIPSKATQKKNVHPSGQSSYYIPVVKISPVILVGYLWLIKWPMAIPEMYPNGQCSKPATSFHKKLVGLVFAIGVPNYDHSECIYQCIG